MIIGTNWILGYSHTTVAADNFIRQNHDTPEKMNMLEVFESGVDTIMGPFNGNPMLVNAVRNAEDRTGRGMIIIDTPIINVDNSPEARAEAEKLLRRARSWSYFVFPSQLSRGTS